MPPVATTDPAPHDVVHHTLARLHTWLDEVPQPQRRLGKYIAAAAVLHVAAFFFVLIDNTRPELQHQVRTSVTLDAAPSATPESAGEAFWDKLTDPRLYVLPQNSRAPLPVATAPLDPATFDLQPVPLPAPAEVASYPFLNQPLPDLAARVSAALKPARQPFAYQENPPPVARATTWQWDDTLAARSPASVLALPSPVSDTEITPTRLRVAVSPDGTVSDVLLDESSQKPDLDRQAILAAQKVRFQPTDAPGLAWGLVTVAWYYTPTPRDVPPPTAPLAP